MTLQKLTGDKASFRPHLQRGATTMIYAKRANFSIFIWPENLKYEGCKIMTRILSLMAMCVC